MNQRKLLAITHSTPHHKIFQTSIFFNLSNNISRPFSWNLIIARVILIYPTLPLIFSHVHRPAVQNKGKYYKPYDLWIHLVAVGSDFFLMKEQKKELRKTNVQFRKCYSKIDIKRFETCSWHLQNKTRKWNEETFYVFFRHSSFIFKKVIIVCFILNSNRREMKSDEVHNLLSPIQSFIK